MGCLSANKSSLPVLLCQFKKGNDTQKNYCLSLKESINYNKSINFILKSDIASKFSINVEINGKSYNIRDKFNEANIREDLTKQYDLLDKHYSGYE